MPARMMAGASAGRIGPLSRTLIAQEDRFGSHNYAPLPVVFSRGQGTRVWDADGNEYIDCLSAYSAVNQGHCHPRLVRKMAEQAGRLTLSSRAFCSDQLGPYAEFITKMFGYDRVLPMNTGVEGGETAVKLARRWGYDVKGVPKDKAVVLFATGNFWGRTLAACSTSDDPDCYGGFGPFLPGMGKVTYNDVSSLRAALESDPNIVAYFVEPVQGEAGVVVPDPGYLAACAELCRKHNVLLICDEVQSGLCRTGRMLASDHEGVRPDVLILGKALSGGMMPVSAVLADDEVMLTIKPGQHGSTYGGNPLACAVATEALQILVDEKLDVAADLRGAQFRAGLHAAVSRHPTILELARGKGLLNAIVVRDDAADRSGRRITAWDVCIALKDAAGYGAPRGVLAKPTHGKVIRLAPPLVVTEEEVAELLGTLDAVLGGLHEGKRT
ncbi:mitochondrial ornithine aminotransferase [Hyaloraphidium curvatum]|nr:mitochondrial ornithine aminotransferase [Hyaloraphidium curvatum]